MAYGVISSKIACGYTADSGTVYIYKHTQDIIDAGTFATNADGFPKPGKGSLRPRHVRLVATVAGNVLRPGVPIATEDAFNSIQLGGDFSYGGINWKVTSKIGERVTNR